MRILFINPPSKFMLSTNVPKFVDEQTGHYPPLGLLYLISSLEKNMENEIRFIDSQAEGFDQAKLEEEIRAFKPDVIGIQMMTFTAIDAFQTASTAKKVNQDIFVLVGGPHANIFAHETISREEIDCIILGEGEDTVVELIKRLATGKSLDDLENIAIRQSNGEIKIGKPGIMKDLDTLPFPSRKHLNLDRYYTIIGLQKRMTTFISSRGCPYRCLFCDRAYWGKIYRKRSPSNVIGEIEECLAMGIAEFDFQDDTFTIDRQRVLEICREIKQRKLKLFWNIRARINTVDEELLEALAEAGVVRIHYGIEAGTPEILKILRKEIDLDHAVKVFRMTKKAGIETLAYFIIGSPSETRSHILRSIDYIRRLDPDYVHLGILTPFPSTDLYSQGLDKGIIKHDYWKEFAQTLDPKFEPPFWPEMLSRDELIELLKQAFKSFYGRPKFLVKQMLKVRSLDELKKKAKAGLSMFTFWNRK